MNGFGENNMEKKGKEVFSLIEFIFFEKWKPSFNKRFMKDLGYDYIDSIDSRTGADFFVDKRNGKQNKTKSDIKKITKNFNNADSLKNPAAVGITLPKSKKG